MLIQWIISLAVISVIPAWIAQTKGHNFWLWWLYAVLFWPVALIHSIVLKVDEVSLEAIRLNNGNKKCPACAELIKKEAVLCKHCGTQQETLPVKSEAGTHSQEALTIHKGQEITPFNDGVKALGAWFSTVKDAKSYIDNNPSLWL